MDKKHEEKQISQDAAAEEAFLTTEITQLGNQAVKKGLISGHGYYQGNYEILCNGQIFLLSPEKAYSYLKTLIAQHQQ